MLRLPPTKITLEPRDIQFHASNQPKRLRETLAKGDAAKAPFKHPFPPPNMKHSAAARVSLKMDGDSEDEEQHTGITEQLLRDSIACAPRTERWSSSLDDTTNLMPNKGKGVATGQEVSSYVSIDGEAGSVPVLSPPFKARKIQKPPSQASLILENMNEINKRLKRLEINVRRVSQDSAQRSASGHSRQSLASQNVEPSLTSPFSSPDSPRTFPSSQVLSTTSEAHHVDSPDQHASQTSSFTRNSASYPVFAAQASRPRPLRPLPMVTTQAVDNRGVPLAFHRQSYSSPNILQRAAHVTRPGPYNRQLQPDLTYSSPVAHRSNRRSLESTLSFSRPGSATSRGNSIFRVSSPAIQYHSSPPVVVQSRPIAAVTPRQVIRRSDFHIYDDSLPASTQPQTPAGLPRRGIARAQAELAIFSAPQPRLPRTPLADPFTPTRQGHRSSPAMPNVPILSSHRTNPSEDQENTATYQAAMRRAQQAAASQAQFLNNGGVLETTPPRRGTYFE